MRRSKQQPSPSLALWALLGSSNRDDEASSNSTKVPSKDDDSLFNNSTAMQGEEEGEEITINSTSNVASADAASNSNNNSIIATPINQNATAENNKTVLSNAKIENRAKDPKTKKRLFNPFRRRQMKDAQENVSSMPKKKKPESKPESSANKGAEIDRANMDSGVVAEKDASDSQTASSDDETPDEKSNEKSNDPSITEPPPNIDNKEELPVEPKMEEPEVTAAEASGDNSNQLSKPSDAPPPRPKKKRVKKRRKTSGDVSSKKGVIKVVSSENGSNNNAQPGRKRRQRKQVTLRKRIVQFLSLAAALFVATPYISGELASFQPQPLSPYQRHRGLATRPPAQSSEPKAVAQEKGAGADDGTGSSEDHAAGTVQHERESAIVRGEQESRLQREVESQSPLSSKQQPVDGSTSNRPSLAERRSMALSFVTEAVQKIGPSVVRIDTETHMLEEEVDGMPTAPRTPSFVQQGQGSGLIFSREGYILTNAHVIEGATKVTVTMTDGRIYEAEVKGADEIVDIAVIKMLPPDEDDGDSGTLPNLPVAKLGDSDDLMVGRIVVAVGSAGGLDGSVTMGIVSGLERSSTVVGIPHKKVDYIQTDAAINPGNSGGPLVDVETGDVVGINAAIRAHMEGTSFSIPINRVRDIMYDLAEGREVQHGYLGVSLATCTPEWAKRNNAKMEGEGIKLPEVKGALVHKVFPRTPAEKGGLRTSDVILEINGERVGTSDSARRLIDQAPVGQNLVLTVLRNDQTVEVNVVPVDLANRLREMRRERQQQLQQERLRFQELGPFRMRVE